MSHVLFAWELGDGLGHVLRMLPLARALTASGHRCSFAVRDIKHAGPYLQKEGFSYLQAPSYPPARPRQPIRSLPDILALVGYGDPGHLESLIVAWSNLFEVVGADLIVCDYSPTACLAAGGRLPVIEIGDTFTSPLTNGSLFLRLDKTWIATENHELVLRHVQTVQTKLSRKVAKSLPEAVRSEHTFLVTLPELCGPEAQEWGGEIVGPLTQLPSPDFRADRAGYFAYLSAEAKGIHQALVGLANSSIRGEIYLRDAGRRILEEASHLNLTVHTTPQELPEAAAKARFIIHHGGMGVSEVALALGRPQLLIPRHQEHAANALRLRKLGCAVAMSSGGKYRGEDMCQALSHLSDPKFERAALAVAAAIEDRKGGDGLGRVLDACLALLTPQDPQDTLGANGLVAGR
jgi:hypothetical protein